MKRLVSLSPILLLACTRASPPAPGDAAPSAAANGASSAPATDAPPGLPELAVTAVTEPSSPPPGPAPSGSTSPADRQRALASLLSGAWKANELPLVSTSPGSAFDPDLRRRLTTAEVVQEPPPGGHRPDVRFGPTTATPPVPALESVVAALRPRFRQCYETGLKTDPSMTGKVAIVANVEAGGLVSHAEVASNAGAAPSVAACSAQVVARAQFSAPKAASTVTIRIIFENGE